MPKQRLNEFSSDAEMKAKIQKDMLDLTTPEMLYHHIKNIQAQTTFAIGLVRDEIKALEKRIKALERDSHIHIRDSAIHKDSQ